MMRNRIRAERQQRGWSQTRLSGLTGIAQSDISALERGVRHAFPGWRQRIAAAFDLPEQDVFTDRSRKQEET